MSYPTQTRLLRYPVQPCISGTKEYFKKKIVSFYCVFNLTILMLYVLLLGKHKFFMFQPTLWSKDRKCRDSKCKYRYSSVPYKRRPAYNVLKISRGNPHQQEQVCCISLSTQRSCSMRISTCMDHMYDFFLPWQPYISNLSLDMQSAMKVPIGQDKLR